jgi:hypothetical protein
MVVASILLQLCRALHYSVYLLYWYKCTNTDAERAAQLVWSLQQDCCSCAGCSTTQFTCFTCTNAQILTPSAARMVVATRLVQLCRPLHYPLVSHPEETPEPEPERDGGGAVKGRTGEGVAEAEEESAQKASAYTPGGGDDFAVLEEGVGYDFSVVAEGVGLGGGLGGDAGSGDKFLSKRGGSVGRGGGVGGGGVDGGRLPVYAGTFGADCVSVNAVGEVVRWGVVVRQKQGGRSTEGGEGKFEEALQQFEKAERLFAAH